MYRIHVTNVDNIQIQQGTLAECEAELGMELAAADHLTEEVLVINDPGNQEAWVIRGDIEGLVPQIDALPGNANG